MRKARKMNPLMASYTVFLQIKAMKDYEQRNLIGILNEKKILL